MRLLIYFLSHGKYFLGLIPNNVVVVVTVISAGDGVCIAIEVFFPFLVKNF